MASTLRVSACKNLEMHLMCFVTDNVTDNVTDIVVVKVSLYFSDAKKEFERSRYKMVEIYGRCSLIIPSVRGNVA